MRLFYTEMCVAEADIIFLFIAQNIAGSCQNCLSEAALPSNKIGLQTNEENIANLSS